MKLLFAVGWRMKMLEGCVHGPLADESARATVLCGLIFF